MRIQPLVWRLHHHAVALMSSGGVATFSRFSLSISVVRLS